MKKTKIFIGAVSVLCVLSFAGCGASSTPINDSTPTGNGNPTAIEDNNNLAGNPTENDDTHDTSLEGSGGSNTTADNNSLAGDSPESNNANENNSIGGDSNESSLIELSTIQGSVVEFSDNGCTITPVENSDDGNEAFVAAPGSEDPQKNIIIHYQSGCTFQIVKIHVETGTKTFSDAEVSDIKKQTSLIIYGEWTDAHNINATKVHIARYE